MDAIPVCQGLRNPSAVEACETNVLWLAFTFPSSDINECSNSTVCGPEASCTNKPGTFTCACNAGWAPTDREEEPREGSNVCIGKRGEKQSPRKLQRDTRPAANEIYFVCVCVSTDVVECVEEPTICGPDSNCTNLIGSHNCTCNSGYRLLNLEVIASVTNPCTGARPLVCVCVCA